MSNSKEHVRLATAEDLAAIVALERATDTAPHWPEATYETILAEEPGCGSRCVFVVDKSEEPGEALAGFAVGLMYPAPSTGREDVIAELESVAVAASARRAGIGRTLCRAVLDWCRSNGATEVVLEVRAASTGAIALYAGLGFTEAGRRPRYYRDPEDDALRMRLQLDRSIPEGA